MNPQRGLVLGAWSLAAATVAWAVALWSTAVPPVQPVGGPPRAAAVWEPASDTADVTTAAAVIRDRNPFRFERRPAVRRFNPWEPTQPVMATAPAAPSRPALSLAGILGGPPWLALIEGIPGRESGVLLAVGDAANGIRFTALRRDTAVVAGFDTTWALTPRRAWQ